MSVPGSTVAVQPAPGAGGAPPVPVTIFAVTGSPPAPPDAAIAFDRVGKRYGKGPPALEAVTWAIRRGARACLLGPNGAGKSTSIRLLQGALRPTSGHVALLGAAVDSPAYAEARRRTGIVPQGPGMYRDLSLAEYLELARRLYDRGDVDRAIETFGLGEHRRKMLAHLSGGFQRRVALAAALLPEPEVLLLDEPTVGLDPVATREVHDVLRRVMPGRTTLLCTHNLAEAEALCDEVIILRGGRVLVHAPLAELRRHARTHVRIAARQDGATLRAALAGRGLEAAADDGTGAVLVPLDDPPQQVPGLLRHLLATGIDVYECRPVHATLEELFLEVVKNGK